LGIRVIGGSVALIALLEGTLTIYTQGITAARAATVAITAAGPRRRHHQEAPRLR
jgi:hypothetical protein